MFLIWLANVLIHHKGSRFVFMYSIFIFNTFANVVRDLQFWHRTADIKAKLVLGVPIGSAKPQLGEGIGFKLTECHPLLY